MEFSLLDFFIDNWVLLIIAIGFFMVSQMNVHMKRRMVGLMRLSMLLLLLLAAVDYLELWTASFSHPTVWRILLSAIGYSIRPVIILLVITTLHGRHNMMILLPALLNTLVCFSALFTSLVFSYSADNAFSRGPLGYTPFVVGLFYLGYLCWETSRFFRRENRDGITIYLLIVISAIGSLAISVVADRAEVFNPTIAADMILYYLYLHTQMTKRDTLTGLLNRQSFYSDMETGGSAITGVMSIDMNELKRLNDVEGHQAGDKALETISGCFLKSVTAGERVYRIGGDEFTIFFLRSGEEKIRATMETIRNKLAETGYACSLGYAVREAGESLEEMCHRADAKMYQDKARYYSQKGHDRRRR